MATINKDNFHINTLARFVKCETPAGTPDFVSFGQDREISSVYHYTKDGVIRTSNHWGGVGSCQWNMEGVNERGMDRCRKTAVVSGYASFSEMETLYNERMRGIEMVGNGDEEGYKVISSVINSI